MKKWKIHGGRIIALGLLAAAVLGLVVMELWNWLTPPIFGWHAITYWQALGLFVLSRILFGGFRGGGHRRHWRMGSWDRMSPEDREKFIQGLRAHGGPASA
jgi:hypothetical protein